MLARSRFLLTTAALVATALAPVGGATAAPTWLPAGAIAPAAASGELGAVDLDAAGDAVAVWAQASGGLTQVVASGREIGGAWSAPAVLSAGPATRPEVVQDGNGRATAVWFRATGPGTAQLQAATRSTTGTWSSPADLPGTTTDTADAALGVRPGGSVVAVWPRLVGALWTISASVRGAGTTWSAPTDLAAGTAVPPGRPRLVVDGAGATTVVWSATDGGHWAVRAASLPLNGAAWSAPVTVSAADQDAVDPDIAVGGNGYVVATWSRWNGTDRWVAQASVRSTPTAVWEGAVDLSAPGVSAREVELATNDFGSRFVAAWTATPTTGGTPVVQAASREGGPWRAPQNLSDGTTPAGHPAVVVGATGPATVAWTSGTGSGAGVQVASLAPYATSFSPTSSVAPADGAGAPRVAADRGGDVLVAWGATGPGSFQPRAAAYDVASPLVQTFHRPGHAVAGHAVTYQAAAVDAFSAVASYAWTFGDGASATGPSVTHTYAEPGRYTVRLRVTDAVGNTSVRTARTRVVDAVAITRFELAKRRVTLADKLRIGIGLSTAARVKLVLRSQERHRVHGVLHRQKLVLRRDLDAGRSTVVVKASRLLADTWVVTATARALGVDSATVRKKLVVAER